MSDREAPPPASETCIQCGGMCCSFRDMNITYRKLDKGERYDSHFIHGDHVGQLIRGDGEPADMKWYVVTRPGGDRFIAFDCNHRTANGLCGVYDDRPPMCSNFECAVLSGDTTLADYKSDHGRPDGVPDDVDVRDVTDRVNEILRRRVADGLEPDLPDDAQ